MESQYLTFLKLNGKKLPPLSGSTPQFPDKYKHLITIGTDLKESRSDYYLSALYEIFSTDYSIDKNSLHFTLGGSMAFFETLLFLKNKVDTLVFEKPFYEPYITAAKGLGFHIIFYNNGIGAHQNISLANSALCLTNPNFFNGTFFFQPNIK